MLLAEVAVNNRALLGILLCGVLSASGCGSSGGSSRHASASGAYAEAGVVAGIAVTAAIIQAARGKARQDKKKDQCCAICDKCSFPCGDSCITAGNICFKPVGCACYDSQLPPADRPPESDLPCGIGPDENGNPIVVPTGVSF